MLFNRRRLLLAVVVVLVAMCTGATVYAAGDGIPDINSDKVVPITDGMKVKPTGEKCLLLSYSPGDEPTLYRENQGGGGENIKAFENYSYNNRGTIVKIACYDVFAPYQYRIYKKSQDGVVGACYANTEGTLANGKSQISACIKYRESGTKSSACFKVKASANGTVKVRVRPYMNESASYYVYLCDSQKKPMFKTSPDVLDKSEDYTTTFGVKKGTYYVMVGVKTMNDDPLFVISSNFKKRTVTKAGATEKKAKPIKLGQKVKCLAYYGKKNDYYYKIKIPKTGTYRLILGSNDNLGWGNSERTGRVYISMDGFNKDDNTIIAKKGTLYVHAYSENDINGYFEFTIKK